MRSKVLEESVDSIYIPLKRGPGEQRKDDLITHLAIDPKQNKSCALRRGWRVIFVGGLMFEHVE